MANRETALQNSIRAGIQLVFAGLRVFRNNVGVHKLGAACKKCGFKAGPTRRVVYGLQVGSHDLIGWMPYTIQPEDAGRKVAVFLSLEVKVDNQNLTDTQLNWATAVCKAGGISGRVRSLEDAELLVKAYRPRRA